MLTDRLQLTARTTGSEINCLWRRPKSHSAYWFFLNRYFAFFGNIAVTVIAFTTLPQRVRLSHFPELWSLILLLFRGLNFEPHLTADLTPSNQLRALQSFSTIAASLQSGHCL